MIKKIIILHLLLILGQSVFAEDEALSPLIDPGYEWRYNLVEYAVNHEDLGDSKATLFPMMLRVIGNETKEGKNYRHI